MTAEQELKTMDQGLNSIYRILDANLNRLREALRVIEEFYRFITQTEDLSISLKQMRHALTEMEETIGKDALLSNRNTETDCFASKSRPEEMNRSSAQDILTANFKRAQEACRVIEEYSKIIPQQKPVTQQAKEIRFSLYALQKNRRIACP
jgi:thiamine-phosphate pyrophosphorylase